MRNTTKDKRIFFAVRDYYNENNIRTNEIALHLTGRKLTKLSDEEKLDIWKIRQNMTNMVYMSATV